MEGCAMQCAEACSTSSQCSTTGNREPIVYQDWNNRSAQCCAASSTTMVHWRGTCDQPRGEEQKGCLWCEIKRDEGGGVMEGMCAFLELIHLHSSALLAEVAVRQQFPFSLLYRTFGPCCRMWTVQQICILTSLSRGPSWSFTSIVQSARCKLQVVYKGYGAINAISRGQTEGMYKCYKNQKILNLLRKTIENTSKLASIHSYFPEFSKN